MKLQKVDLTYAETQHYNTHQEISFLLESDH